MKSVGRFLLALVGALACSASAMEMEVTAGETLVLNTLSDEFLAGATNVIRASAGATLKVCASGQEFPVSGTPGFTVVHGANFPADANWPAVGTSEADALALFKYSEIKPVEQTPGRVRLYQTGVTDRQFDLYAAKWAVAAETTISLFEHFASDVLVVLDGTVVFSDYRWNQESTKKGVTLSAGEHTLVIVVATQGLDNCTTKSGNTNKNTDGRFGHANAANVPGLVYNTANADLTLTNLKSGVSGVEGTRFFENVEGDAPFSVYVPSALQPDGAPQVPFALSPRLVIDGGEAAAGVVTLDLTGMASVANSFRVHGGLMATNGATLVVKGVDSIRCGGYDDSGKHWTFFDAPVVFWHADGSENANGSVAFEQCATVLTVPPRFTIAEGTQLALMGHHVLGEGDVTLSNFDVQLQSCDAVAEGRTLTVGNGRTLSLKPCVISSSSPWKWAGDKGAITNNIVLGGTDARLVLPNVESLDVWGDVSGEGTVQANYESSTVRSDAITTFHGQSTFKGLVKVLDGKGHLVFCQGTAGDAGNTVRLESSVEKSGNSSYEHCGTIRFTTAEASIARIEATSTSYVKPNTEELKQVEDAGVLLATNQLVRIGTWNGTGRVQSDETDVSGPCSEVEIDEVDTNALVRVILRKRFSAGTMHVGSTVRVGNRCEQVEIGQMEGGAQLIIQGPTATTIDDGAHGELVLRSVTDTIPLTVGNLGRLTFDSAATVVVTRGAIQSVGGTGTLVVSNGTVRLANIAPTVNVKLVDGGRVVYAAQAVDGAYDLGADIDPALWLDADASADCFRQLSLKGHPNVVYTNDSVVIDKWFDVRSGQRAIYGFNRRCEGTTELHQQVYPYLLTNSCNGRTTLQFDKYANGVSGQWGWPWDPAGDIARAGRRMPLNQPIDAKYAIMVFGSENGGGTSVLGGWNTKEGGVTYSTPGALQRFADDYYTDTALDWQTGKMKDAATDWSRPIFAAQRPTWVDGVSVDPTATGFNGRYQILSFQLSEDGAAVPVQSLGACGKNIKDAAGQIYGEVLIFTNVLTAVQRQRVERYLSKKWGIALAGGSAVAENPASIEVVPGTSVELEDGGAGDIIFPGAGALTLSGHHVATGVHTGDISLNGGRLEIPALDLPWTEADVAATKADQRAWYDPDDATRYLKRTITNDTRPLAIDALFSKFSGTTATTYDGAAYLSGYLGQSNYQTADANNKADRRPWKATGVRGTGPERTWIDYTVSPEYDGSGNCLRPKTTFSEWAVLASANRVAQTFKTAFIVTDTSTGGGNVICDQSSMTPMKARRGYDYTKPIWESGTPAAFTNGVTRLDGVALNGRKKGYTGRPELLTVQTDGSDVSFYALGYYNGSGPNGETKERSHEILGEMIFYTTILDATTRAGVESYLMKKWLGRVPANYVDWRDATVAGSGTVAAPSAAYLPNFDPDFTGSVSLAATELTFALDDTGAVTNAIRLPAGVTAKLPTTGTITVVGSGKVKTATLIDAGAIEMGKLVKVVPTGWTLNLTPASEGVQLKVEDGKLKLARTGGVTIILR